MGGRVTARGGRVRRVHRAGTPDRHRGPRHRIRPGTERRSGVRPLVHLPGRSRGDAPATTVDLDAVVQEAILRRSGTTTTTLSSSTETKDGSTYIRSDFMTEAAVRDLVAEYFEASDVNRAVRLAWCLSSFNPQSVNPSSGDAGLFQHPRSEWDGWASSAGIPGADVFDAEANVQVAAWLLYEVPGGWTHWSCQA